MAIDVKQETQTLLFLPQRGRIQVSARHEVSS